MKRTLGSVVLTVLLTAMLAVPVSAHGHGGNHRRQQAAQDGYHQHTQYDVCGVEGCAETGLHTHGDVTYRCAGADYDQCTVAGCTATGLHLHDGTTYRCAQGGCAGYRSY